MGQSGVTMVVYGEPIKVLMSASGHVLKRASSQLDKLQAPHTCCIHRLDGERDRVTCNLTEGNVQ
jgi:hypothetical protein